MLTEGDGGPLAVVVAPANVNDHKLLEATIEAVVVERPLPGEGIEQHLCLDKGYANRQSQGVCDRQRYTPHVRQIGQEKLDGNGRKSLPARRWVVERTIGWLNRCRALLVRYAKKTSHYLGLIQIACVLLWYRRLHKLKARASGF